MKSILLKASAGSGKTTRLTREVFERIVAGGKFIVALTFTRAATTDMRSRIMREIHEKKRLPVLESLRLIMEAGRVGYSTIDAFFYRLFAASGTAPDLADEKIQMALLRDIETRFRDHVLHDGKAEKIIVAARILKAEIDALWKPLMEEQAAERFVADHERLKDLDDLIRENGILRNTLAPLAEAAHLLSDQVSSRVKDWVVAAMADYDRFISKAVSTYSDLEHYQSLGKKIGWHEEPYAELNVIFRSYRQTAEKLALNRALLRELAVSSLYELYLEASDDVKAETGFMFFQDVRRGLLALDGLADGERPKLMSQYFSLGLDRTEHLLIDEFQDTSKSDMAILLPLIDEVLSGPGERGSRSFFAVGDWKQMIYGWRGADREALEEAIGGYILNGIVTENSLEKNYRSTPLLVSFFNALVENLFEGKEKTEKQRPPDRASTYDGVTEVNFYELEKEGQSQDAFYDAMVEYIKGKKEEYNCSWGEMALLALTNNHVQKIEAALRKSKIGVSTVKGRQLLSTREGVAVMLFIAGILADPDQGPFAAQAAASILCEAIAFRMDDLRREFAEKYPRPFSFMAVAAAIELLRGKISAAVLDIWQDEAQAFFGRGGADADAFLTWMFSIRFSVKVPQAEHSDYVKVDTIHGTKGLQFRHVFIFWNEDEKSLPFYLESEKCHVQFSTKEMELFKASDTSFGRNIVQQYEKNMARQHREQANVFYVAATRAMQSLTVFLPVKKSGPYRPVHQAVLQAFAQFAPEGYKREIYHSSGREKVTAPVMILDEPAKQKDDPQPYGEIDPTILSASIQAGIMRGERLHRWLAKVAGPSELPPAGELNEEEYAAALRFVNKRAVSAILFRPGRLYVEQQISDRHSFGIVDRMIVSDGLITIIDYKSGSMRGLRQKYEEQRKRYTGILQALYPLRKVEYHVLSIDL